MPKDIIYDETITSLGSLAGRVCAITGPTSGTGYHTAIAANRGGVACILLLNRPSSRAEAALGAVKAAGAASGAVLGALPLAHIGASSAQLPPLRSVQPVPREAAPPFAPPVSPTGRVAAQRCAPTQTQGRKDHVPPARHPVRPQRPSDQRP